jgi:glutamate synthase domain-containing protein 3
MKEYKDKSPLIVVGGRVGSFLGEYQAGGTIIVLGIGQSDAPVGFFTGTGMHGGRIFIRTAELQNLPAQVVCEQTDAGQIEPHIRAYAGLFGIDAEPLLGDTYLMLRANTKNPYKQLYVTN